MYIKDRFTQSNTDIKDLHGNLYHVTNENGITLISEPDIHTDRNSCAYGSYLIIDEHTQHIEEIVEEAYEEISE